MDDIKDNCAVRVNCEYGKNASKNNNMNNMNNTKTPNTTRYVVFFDCFNSNPRGNFDDGNRPTVFDGPNGTYAEVCPTTLKRCIRDSFLNTFNDEKGNRVFIQSRRPLCDLVDATTEDNWVGELSADYIDVRSFGQVLIGEKKLPKKVKAKKRDVDESYDSDTSNEDGNKKMDRVWGPVVVESATSLDPVEVQDTTITRIAPQNRSRGDHNVGTISFIRYARFRFGVYIEGHLANKTGFSLEDQKKLEDALMDVYKYRRSASRPSIRTKAVYRITAKDVDNSIALDAAMDAIQCEKVDNHLDRITPASYKLPEPFENEFVLVERIR